MNSISFVLKWWYSNRLRDIFVQHSGLNAGMCYCPSSWLLVCCMSKFYTSICPRHTALTIVQVTMTTKVIDFLKVQTVMTVYRQCIDSDPILLTYSLPRAVSETNWSKSLPDPIPYPLFLKHTSCWESYMYLFPGLLCFCSLVCIQYKAEAEEHKKRGRPGNPVTWMTSDGHEVDVRTWGTGGPTTIFVCNKP